VLTENLSELPEVIRTREQLRLAKGRVFCHIDNGIPDGIRTDVSGNLWSRAADGIHCVDTTGN